MAEIQGSLTVRVPSTSLAERVYARLQRRAYVVDELAAAEGATVAQIRRALGRIGEEFLRKAEVISLKPGSPRQLPPSPPPAKKTVEKAGGQPRGTRKTAARGTAKRAKASDAGRTSTNRSTPDRTKP